MYFGKGVHKLMTSVGRSTVTTATIQKELKRKVTSFIKQRLWSRMFLILVRKYFPIILCCEGKLLQNKKV